MGEAFGAGRGAMVVKVGVAVNRRPRSDVTREKVAVYAPM